MDSTRDFTVLYFMLPFPSISGLNLMVMVITFIHISSSYFWPWYHFNCLTKLKPGLTTTLRRLCPSVLLNMTNGKFSTMLALSLWSWSSRWGSFLGLGIMLHFPNPHFAFSVTILHFHLFLLKTLTRPFLSPPSDADDFTNKNEEQLGSWWWTGKPGVLKSMRLQRVGGDWTTEMTEWRTKFPKSPFNTSINL